jgi:UPF0755 protein
VVAVVLLLLAGGAYAVGRAVFPTVFGGAPDYKGPGNGQATVRVMRGDTAGDIGATLKEAGVVRSVAAFRNAASDDSRARRIAAGYYRLRLKMSAREALRLLLDPSSRIRSSYVVPEGSTVARTLEIIAKSVDGMHLADLRAAAANPAALGVPSYAAGKLEGFLFPATYDVEPGTSPVDVLRAMVDRWKDEAASLDLDNRAAQTHRSPYEVLTLASLVEGEARFDAERGKVARVALNRLARGMRLGFDSTIQYALGKPKVGLTKADLRIDSPYNSRLHTGLPPTPIDNPGSASLEAALAPTPGSWLYFVVVDRAGHSGFATTYQEFLRLKAQGRRNAS